MLYYYSSKDQRSGREGKPQNTVGLLTATIKPDAEEPGVRFAFRVISPEKEYTLQAENEAEAREWMSALQSIISCLLNGAIGAALTQTPSR